MNEVEPQFHREVSVSLHVYLVSELSLKKVIPVALFRELKAQLTVIHLQALQKSIIFGRQATFWIVREKNMHIRCCINFNLQGKEKGIIGFTAAWFL